jgi:hypothetical protein
MSAPCENAIHQSQRAAPPDNASGRTLDRSVAVKILPADFA